MFVNGSLMWPARPHCVWTAVKFMCTDLYVLWLRACSEVAPCLWLIVAEHETVAEYQFAYLCYALKVCAGDGKVHHFETENRHILKLHLNFVMYW